MVENNLKDIIDSVKIGEVICLGLKRHFPSGSTKLDAFYKVVYAGKRSLGEHIFIEERIEGIEDTRDIHSFIISHILNNFKKPYLNKVINQTFKTAHPNHDNLNNIFETAKSSNKKECKNFILGVNG